MKRHLIEFKLARKRNFGFASVLCSFLLKWVPSLGPRVDNVLHGPRDPTMAWWIEVMRCQGDVKVLTSYNNEFLFWCSRQVMALKEYPYAWIDFRGDLDMPLPPGASYGNIGNKIFLNISFFCIFV